MHAIPLMKRWTKPADNYTEITTHDNVVISVAESRPCSQGSASPARSVYAGSIPTTASRYCWTQAQRSPAT